MADGAAEQILIIGSCLRRDGQWRAVRKSDEEVGRIRTIRSMSGDRTVEGSAGIRTDQDEENQEESRGHIPHATRRSMGGSRFGVGFGKNSRPDLRAFLGHQSARWVSHHVDQNHRQGKGVRAEKLHGS